MLIRCRSAVPFFRPVFTVILYLILFLPFNSFAVQSVADAPGTQPVQLTGPWYYQWAFVSNTIPLNAPDFGWKKIKKPVNPPDRDHHQFLWLKTKLPEGRWQNPSILFDGRGILLAFKAYVNRELIYEFGGFDSNGLKKFPGISPHFIPLNSEYANQELVLLICSDYSNIGIRGKVSIGEKFDLLISMIRGHFVRFLIGAAIIFMGLFELSGSTEKTFAKKGFPYFSILAVCLGFYTLNATNIKDLLFDGPVFWFSVYYSSLVFMPVALTGVFRQIVYPRFKKPFKYLIIFHIIYAGCGLAVYLLAFLNMIPNTAGYLLLNILRVIFIVELLFFTCLMVDEAIKKKNRYAWIYLIGFIPIIISGMRDILIGLGKIHSSYSFAHFCVLLFICALWMIKKQMVVRMQHQLSSYSNEIARRTQEKKFLQKDLHDGVAGLITTIKFLAEMAGDKSYRGSTGKMLSTISELSNDSIKEIRRFINSLDENETDWESLSIDFKQLGGNIISSMGIKFDIHIVIGNSIPQLGAVLYLNLFRIYKEALTNIVRHAEAKNVKVLMQAEQRGVRLEVMDDGIGLDQHHKTGRGLGNMEKRVKEMGGSIKVISDNGTRIHIELPHPSN